MVQHVKIPPAMLASCAAPVSVPAAPFLFQLPAYVPEKAAIESSAIA